jgi:hypothetical protein
MKEKSLKEALPLNAAHTSQLVRNSNRNSSDHNLLGKGFGSLMPGNQDGGDEDYAMDREMMFRRGAAGMLHNRKGSECHISKSKLSQRSLSPFNPGVSYYNAIHNYKQEKSRRGSVCSNGQERAMSSFGGSSVGLMSMHSRAMSGIAGVPMQSSLGGVGGGHGSSYNNPNQEENLPRKSKF